MQWWWVILALHLVKSEETVSSVGTALADKSKPVTVKADERTDFVLKKRQVQEEDRIEGVGDKELDNKKRSPLLSRWGGQRLSDLLYFDYKRRPAFSSWGGKRGPAFSSWGGKRSAPPAYVEHDEDSTSSASVPETTLWVNPLNQETTEYDPFADRNYYKDDISLDDPNSNIIPELFRTEKPAAYSPWERKRSPDTSDGEQESEMDNFIHSDRIFFDGNDNEDPGFIDIDSNDMEFINDEREEEKQADEKRATSFKSWGGKRAPAFNSWGGKRTPAFNSWGGKRAPAFNSWGGKRTPAFNSWGGKRAPAFNSWGGKRTPAFNSWGGKRAPAFNSWGGKRTPAFNSWGGKRTPAFNSWGGKRSPAFNSWGGKRVPAFNSWGGKRVPAFNSWGGKRVPAFNSWGGKRAPAFNSWGGKRAPAFNSWGGKRTPAFNSWGGKRATAFYSWGGKRSPAFNSWGGKRSPAFNSWGGKRSPAFNSWGGKRAPAFNSWGGKRAPAFNSWGGKRAPAFNSWGGKRSLSLDSSNGKTDSDISNEILLELSDFLEKEKLDKEALNVDIDGELFDADDFLGTSQSERLEDEESNRLQEPQFNIDNRTTSSQQDQIVKRGEFSVYRAGKRKPFYSWGGKKRSEPEEQQMDNARWNDEMEIDKHLAQSFNDEEKIWDPERNTEMVKRLAQIFPARSGFSGKRKPAFSSWGGKRQERQMDETQMERSETKSRRKREAFIPDDMNPVTLVGLEDGSGPLAGPGSGMPIIYGAPAGTIMTCCVKRVQYGGDKNLFMQMLLRTNGFRDMSWPTMRPIRRGADFYSWGGKRTEL